MMIRGVDIKLNKYSYVFLIILFFLFIFGSSFAYSVSDPESDSAKQSNFDVKRYNAEQSTKSCGDLTYKFKVKNIGSFSEDFEVDIISGSKDIKGSFSVNTIDFSLSPDSEKYVYVYFDAPCNYHGKSENELIIRTKNTKLKAVIDFITNVEPDFDFVLDTNKDFNFCEQQEYVEKLFIMNNGESSRTIKISRKGKGTDFIKLQYTKITFNPGSEYELNFTAKPNKGSKGTYPITFKIEQIGGVFEKTFNSTINVNKCYDFDVILPVDAKACDKKQTKVPVTFINNADKDQEFQLELKENNYTKLETRLFTLSKDSEEQINILVTPDDKDFTDVVLYITPKSNPNLKIKKEFSVNTISGKKCYKIVPVKNNFLVRENDTFVDLKLKNNGILEATYDLTIENPDNFFSLGSDQVTIKPGEESVVKLNFEIPKNTTTKRFKGLLLANTNDNTFSSKILIRTETSLIDLLTIDNLLIGVIVLVLLALVILVLYVIISKFKPKKKKKSKKEKPQLKEKVKKKVISKKIKKTSKPKKEIFDFKLVFNDEHLGEGYKLDMVKKSSSKKYVWLIVLFILILLLGFGTYFGKPYVGDVIDYFGNFSVFSSKDVNKSLVEVDKTLANLDDTGDLSDKTDLKDEDKVLQNMTKFDEIQKKILDFGSKYLNYIYLGILVIVVIVITLFVIRWAVCDDEDVKSGKKKTKEQKKKEKEIKRKLKKEKKKKEKEKKKKEKEKKSKNKKTTKKKAVVKVKKPQFKIKKVNSKTNYWKTIVWILLLIVLLGLIIYFIDYIIGYIYYIGVGVLILIILIIIDKRRNKNK